MDAVGEGGLAAPASRSATPRAATASSVSAATVIPVPKAMAKVAAMPAQ